MKLIIAGSRTFGHIRFELVKHCVNAALHEGTFKGPITEIVSGGAEGIDHVGEIFAEEYLLPVKPFLPDWDDLKHPDAVIKTRKDGTKYNAAAGPIRNAKMAKYGDALLLIWDGDSKGSRSMKFEMLKLRKPVFEIILRGANY